MKINYLADRPEFIPALARWFLAESPEYYAGKTWRDVAAQLETRLNRGRIPLALVASEDDEPVGTVSLLEESITTHKHLGPWLAALHVAETVRHRGIATTLIEALVAEARALKVPALYIGISRAVEFYTARGWRVVDKKDYHHQPITILQLDLRSESDKP